MKKNILLILFMALLSAVSGLLMSKMSFIGRVGINLVHKEYKFLKIWWQGAIAVFLVLMILLWVHNLVQQKLPAATARLLHVFLLLLVVAGLYFTYDDFHTDISHRLLGHRFHYGFYLGWIGWMLICLFFIFRTTDQVRGQDRREITA